MRSLYLRSALVVFVVLAGVAVAMQSAHSQRSQQDFHTVIPRTWDDAEISTLEVPLADPKGSPVHVSADYYYQIPVRPIYEQYPIYAPGKEPAGYLDWLKLQEPQIIFDPSTLKTEADWIRAGELAFDAHIVFSDSGDDVRNPDWYEKTGTPVTKDGIMPFYSYVIRTKGKIEIGRRSCASCHIRVMPDGTILKGAQGNFPFDRAYAYAIRTGMTPEDAHTTERLLFAAPWLHPDSNARLQSMSVEEIAAAHQAIPPGVVARHPVGLQDFNGVLDVSNDRVTITQLTGESGGGQISARGAIGYRPQLQLNVALQAKNVRIRYQDAIRTVLGGDLNLVGTSHTANLNGRVLIDSLSFTQNFDLATLAGQVQSGPESTPSEGMANKIKLDIAVQTARDLNLTSSAVSLQGQANLHVVGTAADPVVVGRTEFTAGDIFLMNKRYQIERGVIQFSNPNRTEPVLNVLLTTTINQYNLSLTFLGPLDKKQTSYISDPPLPTADIINLIARGQTTQQSADSPSNFGASSLLAQGAASEVSGGLQKLAGLSALSIDPTLGGNTSDPGARIAMQKRVTNNFLFTFATDVTSTQRELIQGEYQFNKRWSASVTRDENGGFAVDGKFHKRY